MSTVIVAYTSNIAKLKAPVYQLDIVDVLCKEENTQRVVLRRCLGYPAYEHCINFTSSPSIPFSCKLLQEAFRNSVAGAGHMVTSLSLK
jgi:hypothetical protein